MVTDAVLIGLVAFVLVRLELVWYKLGKLEGHVDALRESHARGARHDNPGDGADDE